MPTVFEINPVVVVWSMNFFAKPNECCKLRKMFGYQKMKPMNLDSTWQMEEHFLTKHLKIRIAFYENSPFEQTAFFFVLIVFFCNKDDK